MRASGRLLCASGKTLRLFGEGARIVGRRESLAATVTAGEPSDEQRKNQSARQVVAVAAALSHDKKNATAQSVSVVVDESSLDQAASTSSCTKAARHTLEAADAFRNNDAHLLPTLAAKLRRPSRNVRPEQLSRAAAYCTLLAIQSGNTHRAHRFLPIVRHCPPSISANLRILLAVKEGELDNALLIIEEILQAEEKTFCSANYGVTNEALDALHAAIKAVPDGLPRMTRFRELQQVLTQVQRRTSASVLDLLNGPFYLVPNGFDDSSGGAITPTLFDQTDPSLIREIVDEAPDILTQIPNYQVQ